MNFERHVLPNGLRLIISPMPDNPTVTVMVLVEAGSKYETKEISGLSHFLEHMCFKGTTKRPKPSDISRELDSIGASYNAFTGLEYTGYYAKADYRRFETLLDVVSDIYLNSTFPTAELEKEKGVIVEEINMYQDLPQRRVQDVFMQLLYGDQPAGWEITGAKETVKAMKRDDFVSYRGKHYVSGATGVFVSGKVDPKEILKKVGEAFAQMSNGEKHGKTKVAESQSSPQLKIEERKTDQCHIVLGVRSFDVYHPETPILRVMTGVLSGGMSSRLFQKMREELGICYYVSAGNDAYTDHGNLAVSAGVDVKRLPQAVSALLEEFRRLRDEAVSEEELRKVKDYLVGSMYISLESSDAVTDFYGGQEILRKEIKDPEGYAREIEKVTSAEIQAVAKKIFKDDGLNLAIVGPTGGEEGLKKILKI